MNFNTPMLKRYIPGCVLHDAFFGLTRDDLWNLQLVNSTFRDVVDELLPVRPHLSRPWRFHLRVTTENIGIPLYSPAIPMMDWIYGPVNSSDEFDYTDHDRNKLAQVSLAHTDRGSTPISFLPKYLLVHDFTLVYGKLLSLEQLRSLDNLASQSASFLKTMHQLRIKNTYRHGMRFSLEYSRHHAMNAEYQIELSGEVLEYILSHLFLAHTISLWVKDLPNTGPRSLLTMRGIRRSTVLRIIADGECQQQLSPDELMDYILGCSWDVEDDQFNALHGREINLSVNVLENGDDGMANMAKTIIKVWTIIDIYL